MVDSKIYNRLSQKISAVNISFHVRIFIHQILSLWAIVHFLIFKDMPLCTGKSMCFLTFILTSSII